jgi:hypothetical protein
MSQQKKKHKLNTFTRTESQGSFRESEFCPCNLSTKTMTLVVSLLFYLTYFPTYIKRFHRDPNPAQFSATAAFVSVMFMAKETALAVKDNIFFDCNAV